MTVPNKKVLVIGISGATCSGKTTIAKELATILSDSKMFCQDDYYFPVDSPKHVWIPELKHINWDIVSSLDMEKMTGDIKKHIAEESTKIPNIKCTLNDIQANLLKINQSPCHILIVEGFCIFNYKPLADLCKLKYYFTLDYDECFRRRLKRVYEPPDCPGYFEKCVWPEYLKQMEEVRRDVENVVNFDENSTNQCEDILRDILKVL